MYTNAGCSLVFFPHTANTLEKAIFHQSRRLVAEPAAALDLILPSDLELKEP